MALALPGSALAAPARVVFDTGRAGDCDDAAALADRGEAEIVTVVINTGDEFGCSGAAVDAINTYYGRSEVPLAAWKPAVPVKRQRSSYAPALPGPMLWNQFEIGHAIIAGCELHPLSKANPVRRAYEIRRDQDRTALDRGKPSHDRAAVLLAVRGPQPELGAIVAAGLMTQPPGRVEPAAKAHL